MTMRYILLVILSFFLCFSQSSAQEVLTPKDPPIYQAKESDLPDWARQGAFCYLRLDGGPIEAEKAVISDWKLSHDNLDALETLYDQRLDQAISLLKEARFNWIWITYSNGFSLNHESEQRRQCRQLIKRCNEEGIHVCAYMSLTNHVLARNV